MGTPRGTRRAGRRRRGRSGGLTRREAIIAGTGAVGLGLAWAGREPIADMIGSAVEGIEEQVGEGMAPRPQENPTPVPVTALTTYTHLAGARLVYEINDRPTTFAMEPHFAQQLEASLISHGDATAAGTPARLTTYGTWIGHDGSERVGWHHAGRAFDVGRVLTESGDELVSCRYDLWGSAEAATFNRHARAYWRLAATLHRDFEHVLTYLFDDAHANHIHLDNGRSGAGRSTFRRSSRVQVQAVQGMCRHVWNLEVPLNGRYDAPTRDAVDRVLARIGERGRLTDPETWHAFCTATARTA